MSSQIVTYRIVGKRFTCELTFIGALCTGTEPMFRWAQGRQIDWMRNYCQRRGWKMEVAE